MTNEFEIITEQEELWEQEANTARYEEETTFEINSEALADWAFKKIKRAQTKIQQRKDYAESEKKKIDTWLQKENQDEQSSVTFFETHLIRYYQNLRMEDEKAKLSTPNGKVSSRRRQPTWRFDDEKTIEYLKKAAPDAVEEKTEYVYNKTQVKKMFTPVEIEGTLKIVNENGEFVDIATLQENEPSYTVTPAE